MAAIGERTEAERALDLSDPGHVTNMTNHREGTMCNLLVSAYRERGSVALSDSHARGVFTMFVIPGLIKACGHSLVT